VGHVMHAAKVHGNHQIPLPRMHRNQTPADQTLHSSRVGPEKVCGFFSRDKTLAEPARDHSKLQTVCYRREFMRCSYGLRIQIELDQANSSNAVKR
jgi:hypothetical protein